MNTTSIIRAVTVSAGLFVPVLASAAVTIGVGFSSGGTVGSGVGGVAQTIIDLINGVLVPLLFAIAFIVFLYGIARTYIFSQGDEAKVKEGHKLILWGIIAFVVMISIWGLVNVVSNTFGLTGYTAPPTPVSYPSL